MDDKLKSLQRDFNYFIYHRKASRLRQTVAGLTKDEIRQLVAAFPDGLVADKGWARQILGV